MSSHDLTLDPKCVATTGDAFQVPVEKHPDYDSHRSNAFRHAKFSADGTTVVTQSEDHCLRTFILPTDLLDERDEPHCLKPHSLFQTSTNLQSYDVHPDFNLGDPNSTLVLSASSDIPIKLRNALNYGEIHASFPFINTCTEEHRSARSLAFTPSGSHFIAGSLNVIAAFDISRPEEGPISQSMLKPGKGNARTDAFSLSRKGWVSAMSTSSDNILAIGTTQREIALFEDKGLGRCISAFALQNYVGTGVTGLKWSPCGRYLVVAERSSEVAHVFDIRGTGQEVARLTGRSAKTNQVLDIDIVPTAAGFEVWGGSSDGIVRMWANPGSKEGLHAPDAEFKLHDSPVSSAIWHPSGVVLATCSGERVTLPDPDRESESDDSDADSSESDRAEDAPHRPDNTLKIWSV